MAGAAAIPSRLLDLVTKQLAGTGADAETLELDLSAEDFAFIFQDIVRRSPTLAYVTVEAAFTCSKMRSDGFGGMATLITADDVLSQSTTGLLEQWLADAFEAGFVMKEAEGFGVVGHVEIVCHCAPFVQYAGDAIAGHGVLHGEGLALKDFQPDAVVGSGSHGVFEGPVEGDAEGIPVVVPFARHAIAGGMEPGFEFEGFFGAVAGVRLLHHVFDGKRHERVVPEAPVHLDTHRVQIGLAPVYDLVTTTAYLPRDAMALTLEGTTRWPDAPRLLQLGQARAGLAKKDVEGIFEATAEALSETSGEVERYFRSSSFAHVGARMGAAWGEGIRESLGLIKGSAWMGGTATERGKKG
jgi:hypothetical protein